MRLRLALAILLSLLALPLATAGAQSAPQFKLGFKLLADQIPHIVGQPLENEHWGDNGDSLQMTSTGLMAWRKADNWTAFTNGSRTWVNGPYGVLERTNEERFEWESDQPAAPPQPTSQPIAYQASRQTAAFASSPSSPRYGVAEAYQHGAAGQLGISWERLIFSWADVQPGGPGDWRADAYFRPEVLQQEIAKGVEVVGVLQFTPAWAASNPANGQRSVPKNVSAPFNSPDNYWAQFAGRMAAHYAGRVDRWVIWNEPEFKPGDKGAGESYTWLGSDQEYLDLLRTGYQAIKAANPNATVVFGATSYWVDVNMGREPFFKRLLKLGAAPYFDVAAFNIYWCPDDILRVHREMQQAMQDSGISKPIWITETNAMPYDDGATPKGPNGQRVTMDQQADFAVQALAIASAAGYERVGWYRMTDGNIWQQQEVWGLVRDDGSARPVFQAMKTALSLFSGAGKVSFVPLEREDQPFGTPWPQDPNSYYPNWKVYQVVFEHADGRRVSVLWNATGEDLTVRVPKQGTSATWVDKMGQEQATADSNGWYVVRLPRATVEGPLDPSGYHYVGGAPAMLVQRGVPAGAPVSEPRTGDRPVAPGIEMTLDPMAQKFTAGQSVTFTLRLRSIEGFDSPVNLAVSMPEGAQVEIPSTVYPGDRVQITVRSTRSLKPNLYVLPLTASSGGKVMATTNLVLEVPAS